MSYSLHTFYPSLQERSWMWFRVHLCQAVPSAMVVIPSLSTPKEAVVIIQTISISTSTLAGIIARCPPFQQHAAFCDYQPNSLTYVSPRVQALILCHS